MADRLIVAAPLDEELFLACAIAPVTDCFCGRKQAKLFGESLAGRMAPRSEIS